VSVSTDFLDEPRGKVLRRVTDLSPALLSSLE
jgi:hypothetical protein